MSHNVTTFTHHCTKANRYLSAQKICCITYEVRGRTVEHDQQQQHVPYAVPHAHLETTLAPRSGQTGTKNYRSGRYYRGLASCNAKAQESILNSDDHLAIPVVYPGIPGTMLQMPGTRLLSYSQWKTLRACTISINYVVNRTCHLWSAFLHGFINHLLN